VVDEVRHIAFHTSTDLKTWTFQSRIEGYYECPDLFELPVDDDPGNTRWILYAADAKYAIGQFDGCSFTPEHAGKHQLHWGAYYASQTFSNAPDARRVQIGWARVTMEHMRFNQMMGFPLELSLRTTSEGVRMFAEPVPELQTLSGHTHTVVAQTVADNTVLAQPVTGDLFDIRTEFRLDTAAKFGLEIGSRRITYDVAAAELEGMPLQPVNGVVSIRVLVDRPSIEICGNNGRVFLTDSFRAKDPIQTIRVFSENGSVNLIRLEITELQSAWPD